MPKRIKSVKIKIAPEQGAFTAFFSRLTRSKQDYDFDSLLLLRSILSNEKARVINVVKTQKPKSIYDLARMLKRDFKSISNDVKMLEKFGVLDLIAEKTGSRSRLRPVLVADSINLEIEL